ncbi:MAG TPA: thiamine-phosphate kinase [Nitrospira sp.]|nr:thiamine-phosphate kinase [Nitrospira sp.]
MVSTAGPKASNPLREFDLIDRIHRKYGRGAASIVRGIGDDAAVVFPHADRWTLLTTDLLAEDVHFDLRTATFADIGFRAMTANLSDIAAMGGHPLYLLVALAIPRRGTVRQVHQLYRGIMASGRPYGVRLIGGDVSASSGGWFISLTLIGCVAPDRALFRRGARPGDGLYATGTLGDSLAGMTLLQRQAKSSRGQRTARVASAHQRFLIRRHLRPVARLELGQWLSREGLASSAIDLSDGLSGDVRHLCLASRVGVEINLAALPLSAACRAFAEKFHLEPRRLALQGGEDYELLFTTPAALKSRLERRARKRGFRITRIGTILPANAGMSIRTSAGRRPLPAMSYEHFR